MRVTSQRSLRLAFLAALALPFAGCPGGGGDDDDDAVVEPKPMACMIAGGSFEQCYDGWPVTRCASPNQFLLDTTCAEQGLCRDSCSGTWVPCDRARGPSDCTAGGAGNSNEGDTCSGDGDCGSGLICNYYLENTANPRRCLRPCSRHADCPGTINDAFTLPFASCDFCQDLAQPVCVPLTVCGAGQTPGGACDACLDACRGLPSCCTGEGCICDSDC